MSYPFSNVSRSFTAAFPGICAECGEKFERGTMVRYVDHELVHAEDVECVTVPARPEKICPKCHLAKPCFCD